jgi:hypothetical protein
MGRIIDGAAHCRQLDAVSKSPFLAHRMREKRGTYIPDELKDSEIKIRSLTGASRI